MANLTKLENQLTVLQKAQLKTPAVGDDGKGNPKYYSLQGKINQLKLQIEGAKKQNWLGQ